MVTGPLHQPPEESSTPWAAIGAGILFVVVVLAAIVFFAPRRPEAPAQPLHEAPLDPYAGNIIFSGLTLSAAESFAGVTVHYLEGSVSNQGEKTVTGVRLLVVFRNSLGEVVQREPLPLRVIATREPYVDVADLKALPLARGQSREFRLTFEHISQDWDRQPPELRVLQVTFAGSGKAS